jgi:glutamate racemase
MIGILDSGIGGLTVVNALRQRLPDCDLLYFGDTARAPYGTKSAATVLQNVTDKVEKLLARGARIIVIACHTASSAAGDTIRRRFDVPVFEVIAPAVEFALQITRNGRIGVIGTRTTIAGDVYARKIAEMNPAARVHSVACPLLVPLAEEGWFRNPITSMIVKKYLYPLKVKQIDTLILGCNYFPLFKRTIQAKIGKRVQLIDPSLTQAETLAQYLQENAVISRQLAKNQSLRLMVSDLTEQVEKSAQLILKQKIRLEHLPDGDIPAQAEKLLK